MAPVGMQNHISESARLGRNVSVWHFAYVGDGAELGDNVSVGSLAHVDSGVKVGENTRIGGLAFIPPRTIIGRDVFIGPGAVLANDPYPPSGRLGGTTIEDGAAVGAGAVVGAGLRIGRRSVIGMGSVVTKDVPYGVVVAGNPAREMYGRDEYDRKMSRWAGPQP